MPQRFGQASDYSSTFASLYYQNQQAMEASIARLDQAREEEAAARDSLVMTRYQEGKISGSELMAYINKRIRETGYDKAQQLKWKEAAVVYGNQIADERAEAAYAQNGNINALISHYASRVASAANGTPERTELAQRLSQLRDQRDQDNLELQARRMARQVARGDKTTKDLISFYQEKLKELPRDSDLRQQVMDTLVQLRNQYREEQFNSAMTRIDSQLASGAMSPQAAATAKQGLLTRYDVQDRSPEDYWKWMEHVRALRATPDPVEMQKLEYAVATGQISEEQYVAQMDSWANAIQMYDQTAAWELRTEAQKYLNEYATPLPNPGALGLSEEGTVPGGGSRGYSGTVAVVNRLKGNIIAHITQLDGSANSMANCTMASGAMLAFAMTGKEISGADLRYLSGAADGIGTNIAQLKVALEKSGVEGTKLFWEKTIEFDGFKQRVMNGAPAVLSGWLGDIPAQFNSSGLVTGHAMFVAGYDPKRDAFLMLDPAKSSDSGTWWPASVVQDFGWGGYRNGDALFAPPGTVNPQAVIKAGANVRHISVDAPPMLSSTPPSAGGQFDPGPNFQVQAEKIARQRSKREDYKLRARMKAAGIDIGPDLNTVQEVEAELARRENAAADAMDLIEGYIEGYAKDGGEARDVTIGTSTTTLSREDILQAQEELIYLFDGMELLYDSLGNKSKAREMRTAKKEIVSNALILKTPDVERAQGREVRELNKALDGLASSGTLGDRDAALQEVLEHAMVVAEATDELQSRKAQEQQRIADARKAGSEAAGQIAEMQQEVGVDTGVEGLMSSALAIFTDRNTTRDQKVEALIGFLDQADQMGVEVKMPKNWEIGRGVDDTSADPIGKALAGLLQAATDDQLLWVEDGEGNLVRNVDQNGDPMAEVILYEGALVVVPTVPTRTTSSGTLMPGQEGVAPEDQATVGVGPGRRIDESMVPEKVLADLEAIGYRGFDSWPDVVVSDGQNGRVVIKAVPTVAPYEGIEFLTVPANLTQAQIDMLPTEIQKRYVDAGKAEMVLDGEEVKNTALNSRRLQELFAANAMGTRPFEVESLLLTSSQTGKSRLWYRDPGTGAWSEDNLPYTNRVQGKVGHPYVGADIDPNTGRATPQLEAGVEYDPATAGVPIPFSPDMSYEQAGAFLEQQETNLGISIDIPRYRDPADPNTILEREEPQTASAAYRYGNKSVLSVVSAVKAEAEQIRDIASRYVADLAVMDDIEAKNAIAALGIMKGSDGIYRRTSDLATVPQNELDFMLENMGIKKGTKEPQAAQPKAWFDPVEAGRKLGLGVKKAQAAAEASRKAATEKLDLPLVEAKPSLGPPAPAPKATLPTTKAPAWSPLPTPKTTTAPTTPPASSAYKYTPPPMDEEGRTALGGGR